MSGKTFRPPRTTIERLVAISQWLGRSRPEPPKLQTTLNWAVWQIEQLISQGFFENPGPTPQVRKEAHQ